MLERLPSQARDYFTGCSSLRSSSRSVLTPLSAIFDHFVEFIEFVLEVPFPDLRPGKLFKSFVLISC